MTFQLEVRLYMVLIWLGTVCGRGTDGKVIFKWVLHKYGVRTYIKFGKILIM